MLAIETRFVGPTNFRGSRIIAQVMEEAHDGQPVRKVTLDYDHALNVQDAHRAAIVALINKLCWTAEHGYGEWIIGASVRGYVAVCNTKHGNDRLVIGSAA